MSKDTLKRYRFKSSKNSLKNQNHREQNDSDKDFIDSMDYANLQPSLNFDQQGGAGTTTSNCGGYTNIKDAIDSLKNIRRVIYFKLLTEYAEYTKKPGFLTKTFTWSGLKYKNATSTIQKIQEFTECVDEGGITEPNSEINVDILKSLKEMKLKQRVVLGLTYIYCLSIGKETNSIISLIDSILELKATLKTIKEQQKKGTVTADSSGKKTDFKIEKSRAYRKFVFDIPVKLFKDNKEYMTEFGAKLENLNNYDALIRFMYNRILDRTKILKRLRRQDLQEKERRQEEIAKEEEEIARIEAKVTNPELRKKHSDTDMVVNTLRAEMKQISNKATELLESNNQASIDKLDKTGKMDVVAECNNLLDRIEKFFLSYKELTVKDTTAKQKLVVENQNATVSKNDITKLREAIVASGGLKPLPTDLTQPSNIASIDVTQAPLFTNETIILIAPFFDKLKPDVVAELAPELFRKFTSLIINKITFEQVDAMKQHQINALIDFLIILRNSPDNTLDEKAKALINLIIRIPLKFMTGGGLIQSGGAGGKMLVDTFMELLISIKNTPRHQINQELARIIDKTIADPNKKPIFDGSAIKYTITQNTDNLADSITSFLDTSATITTYEDATKFATKLTIGKLSSNLLKDLIKFINTYVGAATKTKQSLIDLFTPNVIKTLTAKELSEFNTETFKLFSDTQLQALDQQKIEGIKFELLANLGEKIKHLNQNFLVFGGNITSDNLATMDINTTKNITQEQLLALSNSSLVHTGLNSKSDRLNAIVNNLSNNLIPTIPPPAVQLLNLETLEAAKFELLTPVQVGAITPAQIGAPPNTFTQLTNPSKEAVINKINIISNKTDLPSNFFEGLDDSVFGMLKVNFLYKMTEEQIQNLSDPKKRVFLSNTTINVTNLGQIQSIGGVSVEDIMKNIGKKIGIIMTTFAQPVAQPAAPTTPPALTNEQIAAEFINRNCQNNITEGAEGANGANGANIANILVGVFEKLAEKYNGNYNILTELYRIFIHQQDNFINNFVNSNSELGQSVGKLLYKICDFADTNQQDGRNAYSLAVNFINIVCNINSTQNTQNTEDPRIINSKDESNAFIASLIDYLCSGDVSDINVIKTLVSFMSVIINNRIPFYNIINIISIDTLQNNINILLLKLNDDEMQEDDDNLADANSIVRIIYYILLNRTQANNDVVTFVTNLLNTISDNPKHLHGFLLDRIHSDIVYVNTFAEIGHDFGVTIGKFMLAGTDDGIQLAELVNNIDIPNNDQYSENKLGFIIGVMSQIPDNNDNNDKARNFLHFITENTDANHPLAINLIINNHVNLTKSLVNLIIKAGAQVGGYRSMVIIDIACQAQFIDNDNIRLIFLTNLITELATNNNTPQELIQEIFEHLRTTAFGNIANLALSNDKLGEAFGLLIIKGIINVVNKAPQAGGGIKNKTIQSGGAIVAPDRAKALLEKIQAQQLPANLAQANQGQANQGQGQANQGQANLAQPPAQPPALQVQGPPVAPVAPVALVANQAQLQAQQPPLANLAQANLAPVQGAPVAPLANPVPVVAPAAPVVALNNTIAPHIVNFIINAVDAAWQQRGVDPAIELQYFIGQLFSTLVDKQFYNDPNKDKHRADVAVEILEAFSTDPADPAGAVAPILRDEAEALHIFTNIHKHFAALIYSAGETKAQQGFIKYAAIAAIARNINAANIARTQNNILTAIAYDIGIRNNADRLPGGFAKCFCKIRAPANGNIQIQPTPPNVAPPAMPVDANDSDITGLGDADSVVGDALRLINAMKYYTEICRLPLSEDDADRISKDDNNQAIININNAIAAITDNEKDLIRNEITQYIATLPNEAEKNQLERVMNLLYKIQVPQANLDADIGDNQKDFLLKMIIMMHLEIISALIGGGNQININDGNAPRLGAVNIPARVNRLQFDAVPAAYNAARTALDAGDTPINIREAAQQILEGILGDNNNTSTDIFFIIHQLGEYINHYQAQLNNINNAYPTGMRCFLIIPMICAVFAASTNIDDVFAECFDANVVSPVDPTNQTPVTKAFRFSNWQNEENPDIHGPILDFIKTLHDNVDINLADEIISIIADFSLDLTSEYDNFYINNGIFLAGGSKQSKPTHIPRPLKIAGKSTHINGHGHKNSHTLKRNIRLSGKNRKHTKKNLNRNKTQKHKKPQRKATKTRH
jgi:hypothetical protein